MADPGKEPLQEVGPLEDVEMTTPELAAAMADGHQVELFIGDALSFRVSLAEVAVFIRHELDSDAITTLAASLPFDAVALAVPPIPEILAGNTECDPAQFELLGRALAARAQLVGE